MSCADWNTAKFFKEAKAQDITHCVAAGSDPNVRADSGYTPLHSAAANSTEPAVVARLLDAGADPEARGETGLTPLHVAAGGSAVPAVVTALVNAGADLGARNDAGYTPLHAAAAGSAVPEMVTVLVNAGADLEARTESGFTSLHVAAGGSAVPAVVTALVNAGADLEARTESGLTPLHVAARSSVVPAVVSALADAGADLEAGTESGFTPLHVAAGISKTPAVVTALVNAGADLEARTESGLTPLHVAAGGSAVPAVVSALVNAGADPNARDQANKTAGDYAQFNDALKDTEAYGQLKDAITIIGPDMVETWMELGSMIVWGIAVLAGLLLWGLYSSRVGRRMRYAGSAVTIMLTFILSLLVPYWAVAVVRQEAYGRVSRRNDGSQHRSRDYSHVDYDWRRRFNVLVTFSKDPEPSDTHRRRHRDVLGCRHCELLRFGLAVFVWLIAGWQWFSSPCSLVRGYGLHDDRLLAREEAEAHAPRHEITPLSVPAEPRLLAVHTARRSASS